jgi:lysophospholipase L1-like esterase
LNPLRPLSRFRSWQVWAWLLLAGLLAACGADPRLPRLAAGDVVLAFGDSLTHGTGADPGQAYPAQLQALIGRPVVNAGEPGETTAEGLQRLPTALAAHQPRLLLLCLGGNDLLRRQDPAETAANLRAMVGLAREQGVAVVLIGVPEPSLLAGAPAFYGQIAEEFQLPYEGEVFNEVLKNRRLKADPIHANGAGYRRVAERLADLLKDAGAL